MQPRMRQLQPLVPDIQAVSVKKVDVDLARNIARMIAIPSERFFDSNHFLQQIRWISTVFDFQNRIEKFARAGLATDRLTFVNPRYKNRTVGNGKIDNRLSRCPQIRKSIAQI